MASQTQDNTDQISSTDDRKRIKLSLSNDCFLDEMVRIPSGDPSPTVTDDDVEVVNQTNTPPVLNIDDPFTVEGKTRIKRRDYMIKAMFDMFDSELYSDCYPSHSKFMSMVSFQMCSLFKIFTKHSGYY